MTTQRNWLRFAFANFLAAAAIGLMLRYAFVEEISWLKFRYWLHAHSHVAMLGWLYLALFTLIVDQFLTAEQQQATVYRVLLGLTQVSVIGMLVTFPVQGYGPFSIAFSTLHMAFAYAFVVRIWRHLQEHQDREAPLSHRFLKTAFVFMVLSTIALWAMPVIAAGPLRGSRWYYWAIQFFLHFQFNGWFLFAAISLWLNHLEKKGTPLPGRALYRFYVLLVISCLLTYALAMAWTDPEPVVFLVNSTGVVLQLAALFFFLVALRRIGLTTLLQSFTFWERTLLKTAFFSFVAKVVIQSLVVLPFIARAAYTIRNFVIGFIHLILLGALTFFILHHAGLKGLVRTRDPLVQVAFLSLLTGFLLSEGLLFLQGTMFWGAQGFLPFYYEGLFAASAFLPLGVLLLLSGQLRR